MRAPQNSNAAPLTTRAQNGTGNRAIGGLAKLPFLIAHLGVLFGGGVSLPLNQRFTRDELRHFLADSGARLAVVGAGQRPGSG